MIFRTDTTLYHPVEGARVFPAGEQDPGPTWRTTPFEDGEAVSITQTDDNGAALVIAVRAGRPGDNPSTQGTSEAETDALNGKFDHDGDGKAGGSKPEAEDPDAAEKADIRKQIEALGTISQPHPRTGIVKLREALEAARAAARSPE